MSDLTTLYERNAEFAEAFDQGDLGIKPNIMTIVLTCVDARMNPAAFLGLGLGDALIIRNVGGRVTDASAREVSILFELMKLGAGGVAPTMGLAVIQHTDCGMAKFAVPHIAEAITEVFGTTDVVDTYAIHDLRDSVTNDVTKALGAVPAGVTVSGHVYDVTTGRLEEIVAPAGAG